MTQDGVKLISIFWASRGSIAVYLLVPITKLTAKTIETKAQAASPQMRGCSDVNKCQPKARGIAGTAFQKMLRVQSMKLL